MSFLVEVQRYEVMKKALEMKFLSVDGNGRRGLLKTSKKKYPDEVRKNDIDLVIIRHFRVTTLQKSAAAENAGSLEHMKILKGPCPLPI